MSWITGLFSRGSSDPVADAQAKVDDARKALEAAEAELSSAQQTSAAVTETAPVGGLRRRKTKKQRKSKSKRVRTGRRSTHL